MPVLLKTAKDIAGLRAAGRIVAETYEVLRPHVVPGVTTAELDALAEQYIRSQGATPTYKGYGAIIDKGRLVRAAFPATICVAVNDVIVHGIPSRKDVLREGDVVGIDIGASYRGWIGDACRTFPVGEIDAESQRLLDVTWECMERGILASQPGNHLGDIGAAIQQYAESQGFSVVREYGGHGVGHTLHEEPFILHFGKPGTGLRIRPGMVFTVEPMINMGGPGTRTLENNWVVVTADGSRSAQFEQSLAITENGPEILTAL